MTLNFNLLHGSSQLFAICVAWFGPHERGMFQSFNWVLLLCSCIRHASTTIFDQQTKWLPRGPCSAARPKLITLSWWNWKAEIRSNHQSLPYGARQTYKTWDTSTWHTVKCTESDSRFNSHVESLSLLKMRRFGWLLLEICLVYAFLRIWHLSRKCNRSYKDLCCRLYFHSVNINRSMKWSKYP